MYTRKSMWKRHTISETFSQNSKISPEISSLVTLKKEKCRYLFKFSIDDINLHNKCVSQNVSHLEVILYTQLLLIWKFTFIINEQTKICLSVVLSYIDVRERTAVNLGPKIVDDMISSPKSGKETPPDRREVQIVSSWGPVPYPSYFLRNIVE